jgi:sialidase-1
MKLHCFAATLACGCLLLGVCPIIGAAEPVRATVFRKGDDGYPIYRIPALVLAANGNLLAFCEARTGGDASEIDLVLKRSLDGGRTWGPLEKVQESDDFKPLFSGKPPEITVGNPCPVVDHLDPEHRGRLWLAFTVENSFVFVTSSDDHGKTWASPRDITKQVKKPEWGWYATGPCHAIQMFHGPHRGRLVVPADHRVSSTGGDKGPCGVQMILSDDHGKSWRLGAIDDFYDDTLESNETTIVELEGGRLYVNTRDQNGKMPGTRAEAFSQDGGESFEATGIAEWKAFKPCSDVLDPPVVQCSVWRMTNNGRDPLVVFSGPDQHGPSGGGRKDLRLRYSRDEAKTWTDGPLIHTGPAAYSDLAEVRPGLGELGVLFEAGDVGGTSYDRIDFTVVRPYAAD